MSAKALVGNCGVFLASDCEQAGSKQCFQTWYLETTVFVDNDQKWTKPGLYTTNSYPLAAHHAVE